MGTKLKTSHSETLYSYWGRTITDAINQRGDEVIVNLASNEYFKSVQTKSLNATVVTPRFLEEKDGKELTILNRILSCHVEDGVETIWYEPDPRHVQNLKDAEAPQNKFEMRSSWLWSGSWKDL